MLFNKSKTVWMTVMITGLFVIGGCLNNPDDVSDEKPQILIEPQSKAAMYGDTIVLKVSVAKEPVLEFQWFKADTMITNAKDSVLVLKNVTFADTGEYFVFVNNRSGYVISRKIHILISGGEPVIAGLPVSNGLDLKDSIELIAQVAGFPPFSYQWYRNKKAIAEAVDSTYKIPSFSNTDSGNYYVIVENSIGVDTSNVAKLYIAGKLFITETDFNSGYMEWISLKSKRVTAPGLGIFGDAAIRSFGGYIYILERFGADNISKYDPSKNDESGFLYQKKLGDNWNPQDIEFLCDTKAYIANLNEPKISIFDPSLGTFSGEIDIDTFTFMPDSNTSPHASDLQLVGSDLYVLLQRRNGFSPGAPSTILKINTVTDKITDSIVLKYKNGHSMCYANGALYVSNPGSGYSKEDGGIEMVDLVTKKVTTIIDEPALGGSPNYIVHKKGNRFYVTSYTDWEVVPVLEIDAETKTIIDTLNGVKDAYGGIYFDNVSERLFVAERSPAEMGVKIFENNVQVGSAVRSANSLPASGFAVVR